MRRITVLPPIRWSVVWAIVVVATLLAGLLSATTTPTRAQVTTLSVDTSPRSGLPGSVFDITGDGWTPNSTVSIYWGPVPDNNLLATTQLCAYCQAFESGLTADVPYVPAGTYTITACEWDYEQNLCTSAQATTTFKVLAPSAAVSPKSARHGAKLTVTGKNWFGAPLLVVWNQGTPGEVVLGDSVAVDSGGSFSLSTTVPLVKAGKYSIVVCEVATGTTCSSGSQDTVSFTVLPPTMSISPARARAGADIVVSGTDFIAGGPLTLTWDLGGATERVVGRATIGPRGGWRLTFAVPDLEPGRYTVTACSSDPCTPVDRAKSAFTLLLTPTPSPSPSPSPVASASPSPVASASLVPATPRATLPPPPSPSPSPTPSPSPIAAVAWADTLAGPGDTLVGSVRNGGDPTPLLASLVLSLFIAYLAPFPFTFFNKTVEANHETIQAWTAGIKRGWNGFVGAVTPGPIGAVRQRTSMALQGVPGVGLFLVISAFVYGFLSPSFGVNSESVPTFVGILIGLVAITIAFDLPLRLLHKKVVGDGGRLEALWWTLFVAIGCVVVSRLATFMPGYVYGLVITTVFVASIAEKTEGKGTFAAGLWLLALSFGCWLGLDAVRGGLVTDSAMSTLIQTALVTFIVAGVEAIVIGLLPLHFLPGYALFHWSKLAWIPVFALGVLGYLVILVNPVNGYVFTDANGPMILAIAFFVVFGLISVLTWALFHFFGHRLAPVPEGPGGPWGAPPQGYVDPAGGPWYGGPGAPGAAPWVTPGPDASGGYGAPPPTAGRPDGPPWPVRPASEPTWLGAPQPGAYPPPDGYPQPGAYPPPYGQPPLPGAYPPGMPPYGAPPYGPPPDAGWPPGGPAGSWPPPPPDGPPGSRR